MKHEHKRISPERDLSETEKQVWDKIIENLAEYFNTTEGDDFYERFATLMTRIKVFKDTPWLTYLFIFRLQHPPKWS